MANKFRLFGFMFAGVFVFCAVVAGVVLYTSGGQDNVEATGPLQMPIAQIASGETQAFAVTQSGQLWGWGAIGGSVAGQQAHVFPTRIGTATNWANVSTTGGSIHATTTNGQIWGWGANNRGQVGDGTTTPRLNPVRVGTASNWSQVASGLGHVLALTTTGQLWAWGMNDNGQVGDGTRVDRLSPVRIGTASDWAYISAGWGTSFAINTSGQLWAWGDNRSDPFAEIGGSLGLGSDLFVRLNPVRVGTATNWATVSAGGGYALATTTNGQLWGWGRNTAGQIGDGTLTNRMVPTRIGAASNWARVSAGGNAGSVIPSGGSSSAITTTGQLWTWGWNAWGQIGDGTTVNRHSPVRIGSASNWTRTVSGWWDTSAINSTGQLFRWGNAAFASNGHGTVVLESVQGGGHQLAERTVYSHTPRQVYIPPMRGVMWDAGLGRFPSSPTNAWLATSMHHQGTIPAPPEQPVRDGFNFAGWTPALTAMGATHRTHTALWTAIANNVVSVIINEPGAGTVTGSGTFAQGSSGHSITAAAAAGWQFTNWTLVAGTGTVIANVNSANTTFTMGSNNATIRANFTRITHAVTVTANPTNGGSVTGGGALQFGLTRNLTASANAGWLFSHWTITGSGSLSNSGMANTVLTQGNGATTATAHFILGYGQIPPDPNPQPENWERGWNILRLHFGAGNAAMTALPGFDMNENASTATRFYDPASALTRQLPTVQQMNAWAANEPSFTNHRFVGWYTNPNWNVATGQRVTEITAGLTGVIRYYARWTNQFVLTEVSAGAGGWGGSALTDQGEIVVWGNSSSGNLGVPVGAGTGRPLRMGTRTDWAQLARGSHHGLGVTTDGELWSWGWNYRGQLGDGTTLRKNHPVRIGTRTDWAYVSASGDISFAITTGGQLWVWGANTGATGTGIALGTDILVPTRVGTASNWARVFSGWDQTYAITTNGQLWAWGSNWWGRLGIGVEPSPNTGPGTIVPFPVRVGTRSDWVTVAGGGSSSATLAINAGGELWAWGSNWWGGTGLGTDSGNAIVPTRVGTASNWASISAAQGHSFAITTTGELWAWGRNEGGRTGLGLDAGVTLVPTRVGTASNWARVSAQMDSVQHGRGIAITESGELFTWGSGEGLGVPFSPEPTLVPTRRDLTIR
ncbi:MAG: hypothetical protein FWE31_01695 [Firmicutes bacterium]|nr:hypothetical protein [Bacillota bacterium]